MPLGGADKTPSLAQKASAQTIGDGPRYLPGNGLWSSGYRQLKKREASISMAERKSRESAKKAPQLTLKERRAQKREKTQATDPFKRKS
ncbi:hypothetical protein GCM10027427_19110 [Pseudoclavibacter terrae]